MRAVRAALAALLARVPAVLPDGLAGFLRLADAGPAFAVPEVDFFFVAAVFVAAVFVFAAPAGFVVESPVVCPATGCRTISTESRLTRHRSATRSKFVEAKTLMSPLYAALIPTQRVGTIPVTQKTGFGKGMPSSEIIFNGIRCFAPAAPSITLVFCSRGPRSFTFRNEFPHLRAMSTIQPIAGELEPHPDVALVEQVRGGDVSAYDTLVRKYDRQIFRIAQHITQNREDAEDVMQDAFLKAYEKLDQFQGNSKFYTWLVRIAVNESLMRLRKRRTGKMVSIDEDVETEEGSVPRDLADWAPDPEQNYTQSELAEILRKTIQGLPQGFRIVFVLRDVEGLSTEETAETLGLSVPAVKSRLLRARLQLRERLSRYFRKKKGSGESRSEK